MGSIIEIIKSLFGLIPLVKKLLMFVIIFLEAVLDICNHVVSVLPATIASLRALLERLDAQLK